MRLADLQSEWPRMAPPIGHARPAPACNGARARKPRPGSHPTETTIERQHGPVAEDRLGKQPPSEEHRAKTRPGAGGDLPNPACSKHRTDHTALRLARCRPLSRHWAASPSPRV